MKGSTRTARSLLFKAVDLSLLLSVVVVLGCFPNCARCQIRTPQAETPNTKIHSDTVGIMSSGDALTTLANVHDYGAKGDGITDDTAAIDRAQLALPASGGILYFPKGTYLVSGAGIVIKRTNLSFRGAGMNEATLKRTLTPQPIVQSSSSYSGLRNLSFEELTFDWDYPNPGRAGNPSIVLYGTHVQGETRINHCRFWKSAGAGVALSGMSDVVIENSVFESPGDAHGDGITLNGNSANIVIKNNRFFYLRNGIIVSTRNTAGQHAYNAQDISISGNYLDFGWWLTKEIVAGDGPSVTYTKNGLLDTQANFDELVASKNTVHHNVRVMPVRQKGKGTFNQLTLNDSSAKFLSAKVQRGDIVRAGGAFAVIAEANSEHQVTIEGWLTEGERRQTNPPPQGSPYVLYGLYLGAIWNQAGEARTTTTIISQSGWFDLDGNRVVPSNGTRYEVLPEHPNYMLHADVITRNITVNGNVFKRGWSDQISIYASKDAPTGALVVGNVIEDGEDMGITLHGSSNYVADNKIFHQGCGGIWTDSDESVIENNQLSDNQWVNDTQIGCGELILTNTNQTVVRDNYIRRIKSIGRWGIIVWSRSKLPTEANVILENRSFNHTTGDIGIYVLPPGAVNNTVISANEGKIVVYGPAGIFNTPIIP